MFMENNSQDITRIQPVISFISIVIVGLIIAIYIVEDENYRAPIILGSFVLGIIIVAFELRAMVNYSEKLGKNKKTKKSYYAFERKVADLFNEDIPFDELEEEREKNAITDHE